MVSSLIVANPGSVDTILYILGVYRRNENLKYFIDITGVEELRTHSIGSSEIVLGANVNLTETMDILTKASTQNGFEYCKHLVDHIDLIANVPVRNVSLEENILEFLKCSVEGDKKS